MVPRLESYEWDALERELNERPTVFYETDDVLWQLPQGDRMGGLFFRWMTSQVRSYKQRVVRLNRRHWPNYDSDETVLGD